MEKNQIDPFNIKNVNFSLIEENDKRWELYKKQRLERGFDESETWSLFNTISQFITPRLKEYRAIIEKTEICPGHMDDHTQWLGVLDIMIDAFELASDDESEYELGHEEYIKRVHTGLKFFKKYFLYLWW